jgi:hypothetical protein
MSKAKLLLTYVVLVGFPLLILLAILRIGDRLTPPQSLAGAWKLEADFSALASRTCRDLFSGVKQPFFNVSQSGPSLALTLNNAQSTTLPGTLQDSHVVAGSWPADPPAGSAACLDAHAIQVRADIAKDAGRRILVGTLGIAGCASCTPVPFRAERQYSTPSEGR